MAAARQNEMNVSITEDATMSLTRSDGGATVVRVDAIYECVGNTFLPSKLHRAHFLVRPWLSLVPPDTPVNKETQTLVNEVEKPVRTAGSSILTAKPFEFLNDPPQNPILLHPL
jgi:hypothetical protein